MALKILSDAVLARVSGGTDVPTPPDIPDPWRPIVPRPPRYGVDPIPAPPRLKPAEA